MKKGINSSDMRNVSGGAVISQQNVNPGHEKEGAGKYMVLEGDGSSGVVIENNLTYRQAKALDDKVNDICGGKSKYH